MLNPDNRHVYTDALRPPPGFQFTQAVATTYSLDLETLLTVPLHLVLFSATQPVEELLKDGVTLLEAIRRTAERVTVFAQGGRILAPSRQHTLYPLLEGMVVEVAPPNPEGAFHPKVWLLRFDDPGTGGILLRFLVLSRNITDDRCWDLVLTLEGYPGGRRRRFNGPLCDLLLALPILAQGRLPGTRGEALSELAEVARATSWELPNGFEQIRFHTLGITDHQGWLPEASDRLAVISPFLSEGALRELADSTRHLLALVSRPEEIDKISAETLDRFERVMVLAEQAELEDGEEPGVPPAQGLPIHGLHAKAYVAKNGWQTHVYVGSANATAPALLSGANVEFMAELIGKWSRVGTVDSILEPENLGSILVDYEPPEEVTDPNPEVEAARAALEAARRKFVAAGVRIQFQKTEAGWSCHLISPGPFGLDGVVAVRAWMATRKEATGVFADDLLQGRKVELPEAPLGLLTSFVAFELESDSTAEVVRFVLNLKSEGLPVAERDAAIVRDVIRNRDGFLRYVMLLLAQAGEDYGLWGSGRSSWTFPKHRTTPDEVLPLFEHLTRAFCRDPQRLASVRRLIEEIGEESEGEERVVPQEFLELWTVLDQAVRGSRRRRP